MNSKSKFWLSFLIVMTAAAALDQLTKYLALQYIMPGRNINIIPGLFDLTLTFNRGAAFGILSDWEDGTRQIALTFTTIVAFLVVLYFVFVEYVQDRTARFALAVIMGGAIGNIIDRARLGMVIDFLDFYIGEYHWPAFNLADSFICVGVAVLLLRRPARAGQQGQSKSDS